MTDRFEFKVVVAGAFAAGKTTLISAVADGKLVGTEAPTSGDEAEVKETTTVGMEYGTLAALGDGVHVDLNVYGVPGQSRFSFMWDIVGVGMDGLVLLVDATRPETWEETAGVAAHFRRSSPSPTVVAVNRAREEPARIIEQVKAAIPIEGADYLLCDPTDPISAKNTLIELLFLVLDALPDDDEGLAPDEDIVESARLGSRDERESVPIPTGGSSLVTESER